MIGVCDAPFKCPPAPSETACCCTTRSSTAASATLLDLVRDPARPPVPPRRNLGGALEAFAERDIEFIPAAASTSVDDGRASSRARRRHRASLRPLPGRAQAPRARRRDRQRDDRERLRPGRLADAGDAIPERLRIGDVADRRRPEGRRVRGGRRAGRRRVTVAALGTTSDARYDGRGSCYIEFGAGQVGRVDVDFLSGPKPTGVFKPPSEALVAEKENFGSSRRARWF